MNTYLRSLLRAPKVDGDEASDGGAPLGESLYGKGTPIPSADESTPDDGAPVDGGSNESEDFSDGGGDDNSEDLGGDAPEGDEQQKPAEVKKPAPFLRIAPEDLAAIRGNVDKNQQGEVEPKYTPAQIKQLTNPVEVTPELVAAIGHEDPAVRGKALQQFAEATVKNAVSLARLLIQRKEKEFEARLGPITEQHQQAKLQETRSSFYGSNKDLVKYDIIVKAAAAEVNPTHPNGAEKSQSEIFKEVASLTKQKLTALGIKLEQQQPNANHSADGRKPVPGANRFSTSGRSGGDQHSGKGKPNNAEADIYAR